MFAMQLQWKFRKAVITLNLLFTHENHIESKGGQDLLKNALSCRGIVWRAKTRALIRAAEENVTRAARSNSRYARAREESEATA
jgi:hypothetical protein